MFSFMQYVSKHVKGCLAQNIGNVFVKGLFSGLHWSWFYWQVICRPVLVTFLLTDHSAAASVICFCWQVACELYAKETDSGKIYSWPSWPSHTQMRDEKSLDKTPHLDKIWKATNFQEQLARLNRPTKSDAWQANFWPKSTNQVLASARTSLTNCTNILELFFCLFSVLVKFY